MLGSPLLSHRDGIVFQKVWFPFLSHKWQLEMRGSSGSKFMTEEGVGGSPQHIVASIGHIPSGRGLY